MSRLLALDQASRTTGWAVFDGSELIKFGKFTATEDDIGERLYEIRNHVKNLITDWEIDEVVFEDIQLQNNVLNNVQTFKILAEVFGIIDELLVELNIPHSAVLASTWKSTLGIKGRTRPEQKKNAQIYVNLKYNIKATQDESDAICIGSHMRGGKAIAKQPLKSDDGGFDWSD